jgi:uncharacterized membrane protein SirB2
MASTTPPTEVLPQAEAVRETAASGFPTRRQLFGILLGYFALHVVLRTWLSSSADLDEAEQLVLTQKLSWGYGSQPPLYTWIQIAFFAVFGLSIFSLSLLKNLLLFCTYALTYANARLVTRSHCCAAAAVLLLLFIPQVAWESQRDLTHSVLASTFTAATLYSFLRTHERRRTVLYLAFGLCAGLGLLSKYNCVFWALGLILAALSLREFRSTVLDRRMAPALILGALVFLPNGLWVLQHRDLALLTASKFHLQQSGDWLKAAGLGIEHLAVALVSFLGPLVIVLLVVFFKAPKPPAAPRLDSGCGKLLSRTLLFIAGMLVLLIVGFRVTGLRERWLQPLLICAPVLAAACVRDRLDQSRLKRLAAAGFVVMLAVTVVMPARIVLAEELKREQPLNQPYQELAAQMRSGLPPAVLIITDTRLLGGNLRLALPEQTIVTPELAALFRSREQHYLLVWNATRRALPPDLLRDWAQKNALTDLSRAQPEYFTATYKFHHTKRMRLGMLAVN